MVRSLVVGGLLIVTLSEFGSIAAQDSPTRHAETRTRPSPNARTNFDGRVPESADTDAKRDAPKPAKQSSNLTFLGDTSRFTRLGGWGSLGGSLGQWGLAKSMLIMLPPVQEELELNERQLAHIREWQRHMRERGEEMRDSLKEPGETLRDPAVPIPDRMNQFQQLMSHVRVLIQENEQGIDQILDKGQRKRLNQIALQMEGISALGRPEVARAINLSPSQLLRIQQIITFSSASQMTTWFTRSITLMNASRQRMATGQADPVRTPGTRQRRNADSTQPDPIPANRGRDQSPENADVQARAQRRQAMEKQFASIRDQTDRIHDHAVREVLKVLTSRQRANFEKLLGEPFDPSRITSVRRDGSSPSAQNREAPESLDRKNGRGETDDEPRSDRDS